MAIHFGLKLISGKDNIRLLPKDATLGKWTAGDIVTLDSGGKVTYCTASNTSVASGSAALESAILGVGLTTEATDANAETNNVHVPISVITPEQVWSIKVADAAVATDYKIGIAYKLGYFGESETYDVGSTADAITVDECYYLSTTAASDLSGACVVAHPDKGVGRDATYGGRVHIRFAPHACMQITG